MQIDFEVEGDPVVEQEQLTLSQQTLRKRDAKFEKKFGSISLGIGKPKMSVVAADLTEFTRLSESVALIEDKVDRMMKFYQERDLKQQEREL